MSAAGRTAVDLAQAPPSLPMGTRDMLSTPPPIAMSIWPEPTLAAAKFTASRPEPQ